MRFRNLLIILCMVFLISLISASVPQSLSLQGKLTNATGSALNGTYSIEFNIYDVYSGGSSLYTSTQSVVADANGVYSVILPSVDLNFSEAFYLGLTVGSDSEMTPRINLTSSPYSFRAENVSVSGVEFDSNVNLSSYNVTTTGTGFFGWLGSLTSRITSLFVGEINATGNIATDGNVTADYYCNESGSCYDISDLVGGGVGSETDPYWTANQSLYYNKTDVDTNISSANTSMKNYVDTTFYLDTNPFSFYNSTTLPSSEETNWNANYSDFLSVSAWNDTGLIRDWNATGLIIDWNSSSYIIDWNSTGYIRNWEGEIVSANTSLYNWVVAQGYTAGGISWSDAVNGTLYLSSNPFGFYNSTDFSISNYYLESNPYSYYNSTTLPPAGTETDPYWTTNQSLYYNKTDVDTNITSANNSIANWVDNLFVRFTELVSQIGNWSADKSSYYNKTDVDTNITSANTSLYNWVVAQDYGSGSGSMWNITTSEYLYNNSNILDVNESKLNLSIDARFASENLSVFTCPSGFTKVESQGYVLGCIQNDEEGTATVYLAIDNCFTKYGGRLPFYSEWFSGLNNSDLSNEIDDYEWIDSGYYEAYQACGSGSLTTCTSYNTGSHAYRCFIPASGRSDSLWENNSGVATFDGSVNVTGNLILNSMNLTVESGGDVHVW